MATGTGSSSSERVSQAHFALVILNSASVRRGKYCRRRTAERARRREAAAQEANRRGGRARCARWLDSSPMSKFNNKVSFYMLMFCSVGTVFNLALLNFSKWSVCHPSQCTSASHTSLRPDVRSSNRAAFGRNGGRPEFRQQEVLSRAGARARGVLVPPTCCYSPRHGSVLFSKKTNRSINTKRRTRTHRSRHTGASESTHTAHTSTHARHPRGLRAASPKRTVETPLAVTGNRAAAQSRLP